MRIVTRIEDVPEGAGVAGVRGTVKRQDDGVIVATAVSDDDGWITLQANGAPGNVLIDYERGSGHYYQDSRSMRPFGALSPAEWQEMVDKVVGDGVLPYGDTFSSPGYSLTQITIYSGAAILNGVLGVWYSPSVLTITESGDRCAAIFSSGTGKMEIVDVAVANLTSDYLPLYTYTYNGSIITNVVDVQSGPRSIGRPATLQGVARKGQDFTTSSSGEPSTTTLTLFLQPGVTYDIAATASVIPSTKDGRLCLGAIAVEIDGDLSAYQSNGTNVSAMLVNSHTKVKTGGTCLVRLYHLDEFLDSTAFGYESAMLFVRAIPR